MRMWRIGKRVPIFSWKTSRTSLIVVLMLCASTVFLSAASGPSIITIYPASQTVSSGDPVTISVNCSPQQPIKAFQFDLSFNPALLQATSVSEGSFFKGYTTFFNPGTIDNVNGTIVHIYDLIVGPGNVTNAGTFISVNFTAKSSSDTTTLALNNLGVTNETDFIQVTVTTASVTVNGPSLPPYTPPPSEPPSPPPLSSQNQPPSSPLKPLGPALIELGVPYVYNSSAVDPDGDRVRLRFDWGDGSLSNWTEFVSSNTMVSMSHTWRTVSNYTVRVIAQDENNSNSSWSDPLTVIVSQATSEGNPPVVDFVIPSGVSANQTVVFNASGSYAPAGVIVSYQWDFGDGVNGTGKTPVHIYQHPGQYTVTLTITDDSGMTYSTTQLVTVSAMTAGVPTEKNAVSPFSLSSLVLVVIFGVILSVLVIFRDRIKTFVIQWSIDLSRRRLARFDNESVSLEQILDALFMDMQKKTIEPSVDYILDAYSGLIIDNVEKKGGFRLPVLSIEEIERLVDDRIHALVVARVDMM